MSALIDATAVPDLPADPTVLIAAADAMAPASRTVRQRVADAAVTWRTLPDVFDTPDTGTVVSAMQPATAAAIDFDTASAAASQALRSLGENLAALQWTRTRLLDDIATHRSAVIAYRASEDGLHDDPSDQLAGWGPYGYSENEELTQRCASLRALICVALEECEHDLGRIGDIERASPVMWTSVSPPGPSLTWTQRSAAFSATVSMTILQRLASMDADEMTRLRVEHPDWQTMVSTHPPAAREVAEWWRGLDDTCATALIAGASPLIGNLEGVAYTSRDLANRATLAREIGDARAALDAERKSADLAWGPGYGVGGGRDSRLKIRRERLDNLLNIEGALVAPAKAPARLLIALSEDHPPLASVAIGDLDTGRTVTFAVPGMGTTTRDMEGWTDAAQNLFDEQQRTTPDGHAAVVAWIGYRTPPVPVSQGRFEVLGNEYATSGGENLSKMLAGFVATRHDAPSLSVIGHSYGTTTAAVALTLPGTPRIDAFVSLGSAGLPASIDSAADLRADAVYAGQARNVIPGVEDGQGDQWAWTGRMSPDHPVDPTSNSFGAHAFGADGDNGMHPVTDHSALVPAGEGWGYFDSGTEALRNAALSTTGRGDRATLAVPKGPTPVEQYWKDVMSAPGFGL